MFKKPLPELSEKRSMMTDRADKIYTLILDNSFSFHLRMNYKRGNLRIKPILF